MRSAANIDRCGKRRGEDICTCGWPDLSCTFGVPDESSAAQDQDVALVRSCILGEPPFGTLALYEEEALNALGRIERRLATGADMAALVDECVKAGHIKAVKP